MRLSHEALEMCKEVNLDEIGEKIVKWADTQLDLHNER
nr:MAG TPA: hypothetical protein [Caudoviricetes sp.]